MASLGRVNAISTEDRRVIQEQWQKEIQLEFREKPLNPAVISIFLQVFLLYNAKNRGPSPTCV